jgi:hypothetical protein
MDDGFSQTAGRAALGIHGQSGGLVQSRYPFIAEECVML